MYLCAEPHTLQISDETYWQQMAQGDKKAYEQVFRAYYELLCKYAYTVVRDKDEAEEVVQNLFYNVWKKREQLQIQSSVKSYLYRAVRNDCLNRVKHDQVRHTYAMDYRHTAPISGNGLESLEAKELSRHIREAVETLPTQCAEVFRLSRFEQLSYAEIAQRLDISTKTVENHMGKALRRMREQLKDFLTVVIALLIIWLEK
jgi:RNA polymerase sigma-70 factor (ECF subfamily)